MTQQSTVEEQYNKLVQIVHKYWDLGDEVGLHKEVLKEIQLLLDNYMNNQSEREKELNKVMIECVNKGYSEQLKEYKSSCCDSEVYTGDIRDVTSTLNVIRCKNCRLNRGCYKVSEQLNAEEKSSSDDRIKIVDSIISHVDNYENKIRQSEQSRIIEIINKMRRNDEPYQREDDFTNEKENINYNGHFTGVAMATSLGNLGYNEALSDIINQITNS